jgi:hypothetical protein
LNNFGAATAPAPAARAALKICLRVNATPALPSGGGSGTSIPSFVRGTSLKNCLRVNTMTAHSLVNGSAAALPFVILINVPFFLVMLALAAMPARQQH